MTKFLIASLLGIFVSLSARADFPSFDLRVLPVLQLPDDGSTPQNITDATIKLDRAVAASLAHATPQISQNLYQVYSAYVAGAVKSVPQKVSSLITGNFAFDTQIWSGSSVIFDSNQNILGFMIFDNSELSLTPFFMRFLLIRESFGHIAQMMNVWQALGSAKALSMLVANNTPQSNDFMTVSQATAALAEYQILRLVQPKILIDSVNASNLPIADKQFFIDHVNFASIYPPTEYIKWSTRTSSCPKETPLCVTDAQFEIIFSYFRSQGFAGVASPPASALAKLPKYQQTGTRLAPLPNWFFINSRM